MKIVLSVVVLLLFGGCAATINANDSAAVRGAVEAGYDPYKKLTTLRTPPMSKSESSFYGPKSFVMYWLVGYVPDGGGQMAADLVVEYHGDGWAFIQSARDRSSKAMSVKQGVRQIGGVHKVLERVAVEIPDADMNLYRVAGIDMQLSGQREFTIQVPKEYVEGFAQALAKTVADRRSR